MTCFEPRLALLLGLAVLVPMSVAAGTVSVPNTFSNGTLAVADEVNANFDVLEAESNAHDAQLDALENAVIGFANCAYTPCADAPEVALCPAGKVMIGIDIPEFGGDEGSCNPAGVGTDDFRVQCCDLVVTTP